MHPGRTARARCRQVLGLTRVTRMRAYAQEYTVAGQFRIRTGFPCGDSEHEHTSCAGLRKHPYMLCRCGPVNPSVRRPVGPSVRRCGGMCRNINSPVPSPRVRPVRPHGPCPAVSPRRAVKRARFHGAAWGRAAVGGGPRRTGRAAAVRAVAAARTGSRAAGGRAHGVGRANRVDGSARRPGARNGLRAGRFPGGLHDGRPLGAGARTRQPAGAARSRRRTGWKRPSGRPSAEDWGPGAGGAEVRRSGGEALPSR